MPLSTEAVQTRSTCAQLTAVACCKVGTVGATVSAAGGVVALRMFDGGEYVPFLLIARTK